MDRNGPTASCPGLTEGDYVTVKEILVPLGPVTTTFGVPEGVALEAGPTPPLLGT